MTSKLYILDKNNFNFKCCNLFLRYIIIAHCIYYLDLVIKLMFINNLIKVKGYKIKLLLTLYLETKLIKF